MRHFEYDHLPQPLRDVSMWFAELARQVEAMLPVGPEKSAGLRKLLEAKDCAVRAARDLPSDADVGRTAEDIHAAAQRVIDEDAVRNPEGHPCRDCGQIYRNHPHGGCAVWR